MTLSRRSWLFFAFAMGSTAAAGCGGGKNYWNSQPLVAGGITIQPIEVYATSRKLYVRTTLVNQTAATVTINRGGITATLPTGQTIPRSVGTYSIEVPYTVPPGGSHAIHFDFESRGFRWRDTPAVQVNFTGAILADGAPVEIPPFIVQQ
jgi:hypothetical protein